MSLRPNIIGFIFSSSYFLIVIIFVLIIIIVIFLIIIVFLFSFLIFIVFIFFSAAAISSCCPSRARREESFRYSPSSSYAASSFESDVPSVPRRSFSPSYLFIILFLFVIFEIFPSQLSQRFPEESRRSR